MRVLELGSYVAPAYAGMILAEQGHEVTKWTTGDPIHGLRGGDRLWAWINEGKTIIRDKQAIGVKDLMRGDYDVVIDNFRADTWAQWGVDLDDLAAYLRVTWVSLRADDDGRSFDVVAQQRAWGDLVPPVPFYLGDTAAGLWMSFAALAKPQGHHVIRQATCLAKLVEGEAMIDRTVPWDAWRLANLPNVGGRFSV